jgi:hypothetical protein
MVKTVSKHKLKYRTLNKYNSSTVKKRKGKTIDLQSSNLLRNNILDNSGLPDANILSQFIITDENLLEFDRTFKSPMDCVINALQIMKVLDSLSANIMRISTAGVSGFTKEQIEIIFAYVYRKNYDFKSTANYDEWVNYINSYLNPGNMVFAGYSGHVFIIGRNSNGVIVYIDPQNGQLCNLSEPECENYVKMNGPWFLLFNSVNYLTAENEATIIHYAEYIQRNKALYYTVQREK